MKLIVQPRDGVTPLIQGIEEARHSIDIVIFRFDRNDVERALENAVARGVAVHALIAYLNRGGEKKLRRLEMRLLEAGVTVARTSDDLIRYHDKMMIVDKTMLYVLAFNYTYLDIDHSRSFGIVTDDPSSVKEALSLFAADTQRKRYTAEMENFVVSPVNARQRLAAFIEGASRQLLIYDPKVSDRPMIKLLVERARQGVDVRIIGRLTRRAEGVLVRDPAVHLHSRTIVRDGEQMFVGSQSLSADELDARREVGIIVDDQSAVAEVIKTFEDDWVKQEPAPGEPESEGETPAHKAAKKAVKAISKELPPVVPILEEAVRKAVGADTEIKLDAELVEETVRGALKEVVREVVKNAVQDAVERQNEGEKVKA